MAFSDMERWALISQIAPLIEGKRPPDHIRPQLDYAFEFKDQSVFILEVRPFWNDPTEIMRNPFAKATYVKSRDIWKVYWMRGNLKWYPYDPQPTVRTLREFWEIVDEDKYHCFFG